jgi:hypothetical protein
VLVVQIVKISKEHQTQRQWQTATQCFHAINAMVFVIVMKTDFANEAFLVWNDFFGMTFNDF